MGHWLVVYVGVGGRGDGVGDGRRGAKKNQNKEAEKRRGKISWLQGGK